MNGRAFTPEEDAAILTAGGTGKRGWYDPLTIRFSRTAGSLIARYQLLLDRGLRKPASAQKIRKCLRCEAVFVSDGPGNRMCDSCGKSDRGLPVHAVHLSW
jgi:hypothetical protein